jgi:predicted ABC-type ATPase
MKNLKDMIIALDAELTRVKLIASEQGHHHGTAQNVIMRRYQTELKTLARLMRDDLLEENIINYDNKSSK